MKNQKSKFESNNKYFTISIYALCVIIIGAIVVRCVFNWENTSKTLSAVLSILSPFLYGILIAYFINPVMRAINVRILDKLFHIKSLKVRSVLSLLLAYLIAISFVAGACVFVLPQVFNSFYELCLNIPSWYSRLMEYFMGLEDVFPYFDFKVLNQTVAQMGQEFFSSANITNFISVTLPVLLTTSISLVKWVVNFILAFMISCYLLVDKKLFSNAIKKIMRAFLSEEKTHKILVTTGECHLICSGFIYGKFIDSLIIGIIAFCSLSLLKMPYTLLISLIIGVTNMIPYFGPFIGAVPGALIILMISPVQAVVYIIFVIVLQQFDGLYLGPKILGDITGLRPIAVLFAITAGGAAGGVIGMFLGVPVVAVLVHLFNKYLDYRMKMKEITAASKQEPL